jgi:isoleucyl-tRNA synthetase
LALPDREIRNPKSETGCGNIKVVGSIGELEKLGGQKIKDAHRPFIDEINFKCEKCGGQMTRVKEVLDCWFDSGAMPFAQWHYPFENKEKIDKGGQFPADFISEAIDQTRGWFYTLLAISTLLDFGAPYKNVVCLGHVLDAKGQKMSKSKGNVVDPWQMIEKYGSDALRFYMYTVNQPGDPKCFDEKDLDQIVKKTFLIFWNIFTFWQTYAENQPPLSPPISPKAKQGELEGVKTENILDKWILSKLNLLIKDLTDFLDGYDITAAGRKISDFINDLSTWYLRRSRERFKGAEAEMALNTLGFVLLETSKLFAPFAPFLAEKIYRESGGEKDSVHLEDWPGVEKKLIDEKVMENMELTRKIVSLALEERANVKIPVRQVLQGITVNGAKLNKEYLELIKDEVNVKEIKFGSEKTLSVILNTEITPELRREGIMREIVRQVNALRKEAGLTIKDKIILRYETSAEEIKKAFEEFGGKIASSVIAEKIEAGKKEVKNEKTIKFDEGEVWIGLE